MATEPTGLDEKLEKLVEVKLEKTLDRLLGINGADTFSLPSQRSLKVPKKRTFKFTAHGDGNFTYDPNTDWDYITGDELVFKTESGPFALRFESLETSDYDLESSLQGEPETIVSNPSGDGSWVASGKVETRLTEDQIRHRYRTIGRVAQYRYNLTVSANNGQSTFSDNSKNGTWKC